MNQIVMDIGAKCDTAGFDKAKSELKGIEKATESASSGAEKFSSNYDGLAKKMAMPMKRMAFSTLSQELLGASAAAGKLSGATGAVTSGLMSVSSAFMYMSPAITGVAIGLTAVLAIYSKLSESSKSQAEAIKTKTEKMYAETEQFKENIRVMEKRGMLNDAELRAAKAMTKEMEKSLDAEIRNASAKSVSIQTTMKAEEAYRGYYSSIGQASIAVEGQTATEKTLQEAMKDKAAAMVKTMAEEKKDIEMKEKMKQKAKEWAAYEVSAYEAALRGLEKYDKEQETKIKSRAAMVTKYTMATSEMFRAENGKVLGNAREMFSSEVKAFADMEATKMEMKAAASFATPGLAALYIAAAIAIRAAGSAAASAITAGGQKSTSATTSGGGAAETGSSTAETGATTEGTVSQKQVIINIQGDFIGEPSFAQHLAKILTNAVQGGDATLVSTSVKPQAGVVMAG